MYKLTENHKHTLLVLLKLLSVLMKEFDEILRSDSTVTVDVSRSPSYNFVYLEGFHAAISKLFEGSFHQGIKLRITDKNIRIVIILSSIHLLSVHTHKNSSDEPLSYL